jgi:hypothetical protein
MAVRQVEPMMTGSPAPVERWSPRIPPPGWREAARWSGNDVNGDAEFGGPAQRDPALVSGPSQRWPPYATRAARVQRWGARWSRSGCDGCRVVEKGATIKELEHFGCGSGSLRAGGCTVVGADCGGWPSGHSSSGNVAGQSRRGRAPRARRPRSRLIFRSSSGVVVAAEERIGFPISVERGLEYADEASLPPPLRRVDRREGVAGRLNEGPPMPGCMSRPRLPKHGHTLHRNGRQPVLPVAHFTARNLQFVDPGSRAPGMDSNHRPQHYHCCCLGGSHGR